MGTVLPFEATTLADIGFDGDILHATGYSANCGCNDALHVTSESDNPVYLRQLEAVRTEVRAIQAAPDAEVPEAILQLRLADDKRWLAILDAEAPDLANFVRIDALTIEGAQMQLGRRKQERSSGK